MHKVEPVKRLLEKATGLGVPPKAEALSRVTTVRPVRLKFSADGYIPNNPNMPLLIYKDGVRLGGKWDPAALLEAIFNANGWGQAWRNGIYDYVHYHPRIHEVLGVARGTATLRLGGNKGRTVKVRRRRRRACSLWRGPRVPEREFHVSCGRRLSSRRRVQRVPGRLSGIRGRAADREKEPAVDERSAARRLRARGD